MRCEKHSEHLCHHLTQSIGMRAIVKCCILMKVAMNSNKIDQFLSFSLSPCVSVFLNIQYFFGRSPKFICFFQCRMDFGCFLLGAHGISYANCQIFQGCSPINWDTNTHSHSCVYCIHAVTIEDERLKWRILSDCQIQTEWEWSISDILIHIQHRNHSWHNYRRFHHFQMYPIHIPDDSNWLMVELDRHDNDCCSCMYSNS